MVFVMLTCHSKICKKCGRELPILEFWKQMGSKDNHYNKCKECMGKNFKNWLIKNRKKRTQYQKDWRRKNLQKVLKLEKQFRDNNKEYYKFIDYAKYHFPLDYKCNLCGSKEKLQRHHPRYFDFDINYAWIFCTLCHKCHIIEDKHREEWIVEELKC